MSRRRRRISPVATVRQGQFIPATIAPKLVHRVGHFHDGDVFVQRQALVIRESGLALPASGVSGIILINDPATALVKEKVRTSSSFGIAPSR